MTEALTGIDRSALLAERAEAEAQLRAAEATLGISAAAGSDPGSQPPAAPAAGAARAADDELALAASEAAERPPTGETLPGSSADQLGTAESAFARAVEIQEDLPAAWRRLVGALISATGMAIVIGALGWNPYWLLVPIALIAVMTVDLRLAGHAARAVVAEIRLLCAAARIRIGDPHRRALGLVDFVAAAVTNEHCLPGHAFPPGFRWGRRHSSRMADGIPAESR